jgi:hypothetical protein
MAAATKAVALALAATPAHVAFPDIDDIWTIAVAVSRASRSRGATSPRSSRRTSSAARVLVDLARGLHADRDRRGNSLGGRALLYYLIPYSAISVGAFAVVAARERELGEPVTLANLAGFGWERPLLGFSMATFMLGFAGFPLTGGFMGKFLIFSAASEAGWNWLVIVGVARDARQPLLLPRRDPVDVHAPAASSGWRRSEAHRRARSCSRGAAFIAMVVNVGAFFAVHRSSTSRAARRRRYRSRWSARARGAFARRQPEAGLERERGRDKPKARTPSIQAAGAGERQELAPRRRAAPGAIRRLEPAVEELSERRQRRRRRRSAPATSRR